MVVVVAWLVVVVVVVWLVVALGLGGGRSAQKHCSLAQKALRGGQKIEWRPSSGAVS